MDIQTIINTIERAKGANMRATWMRPMRVFKGVTLAPVKITHAVVRTGLTYDNMRAVQAGRASGTLPPENMGLPPGQTWHKWPWIIRGKDGFLLRLYPSSLGIPARVQYMLAGREIAREELRGICLASEFDDAPRLCWVVRPENLVSLKE